jgi:hypothetical protein
VFGEARRLFGSRAVAVLAWLAYLAPLPVLLYAGQVFPSTLASCATFLGFVLATRHLGRAKGRGFFLVAAAIAALAFLLPWVHIKYLLPALVVAALALVAMRARLRWPPVSSESKRAWVAAGLILGCALLSILGIGIYSRHYFGTWMPPNGATPPDWLHPHFANIWPLYGRMFLDPRSGLLPWVPLDLLVIPGLVVLLRRMPPQGWTILVFLVAQLVTFVTAAVSSVSQGYALIGRFTLECAPFFALCVGAVFWAVRPSLPSWPLRSFPRLSGRHVVAGGGLLLLAATIWFALVGEFDPSLLYPGTSVRLVAQFPHLLPGPWFALFPWF